MRRRMSPRGALATAGVPGPGSAGGGVRGASRRRSYRCCMSWSIWSKSARSSRAAWALTRASCSRAAAASSVARSRSRSRSTRASSRFMSSSSACEGDAAVCRGGVERSAASWSTSCCTRRVASCCAACSVYPARRSSAVSTR